MTQHTEQTTEHATDEQGNETTTHTQITTKTGNEYYRIQRTFPTGEEEALAGWWYTPEEATQFMKDNALLYPATNSRIVRKQTITVTTNIATTTTTPLNPTPPAN